MNFHRNAFSLAEIMVGIVIMAVIFFPTLTAIMSETKTVTGTRDHSQAAFLGQRILETARTYNFEKLDKFADEYRGKVFKFNEVDFKIENIDLSEIKTKDPPGKIAAKKLTFSIKYTSQRRDLSLDLASVIGRHE
ncbi:hypothetical protein HYY75_03735 [bacterium]|nr:hypothetical protein [bacterium]